MLGVNQLCNIIELYLYYNYITKQIIIYYKYINIILQKHKAINIKDTLNLKKPTDYIK